MKYYYIRFEKKNKIAYLHFHRLDKLNAINFEMVREINHALSNVDTSDINALFIQGHQKAFSAGGDLKEMQQLEKTEARKRIMYIHNTFKMLKKIEVPVISFIQGICFGGGLEFALHTDIRICSSESKFAFPEVKYGMIPGAGGTVLFAKQTNEAAAAFYLLTGEEFTADHALRLNLVQKVVIADNFEKEVELQEKYFINANSDSLKAIKHQMLNYNSKTTEELYYDEAQLFNELLMKNGKDEILKKFL
ncbi:MAG: enoyl-CoA hydratase/isomerase family protein [Salinivirgaceae bacterium]|nr:enoyl-CoA hydratase/isomerase family protein [Salinivirgaceae bacterium]